MPDRSDDALVRARGRATVCGPIEKIMAQRRMLLFVFVAVLAAPRSAAPQTDPTARPARYSTTWT
jgi:hypothetical protein